MTSAVVLCLGHFSPPTVAHLRSFERARDFVYLALGIRVVEGILAPLAGESHGLSAKHRMRMVEAAVRRSNWLRLGAWQCSQSTSTPRPITIIFHYATECRMKYGEDTRLFLLCGDDLLLKMGEGLDDRWSDAELNSLLSHHGLLIVKSGSTSLGDLIYRHEIFRRHQTHIHVIEDETFPNSLNSVRVRTALRRGESVRYCVDDEVLDYIQEHNLFEPSSLGPAPSPTPPSPPRMAPLSFRTPPPSETSTQGESCDGNNTLVASIITEKQLFEIMKNAPVPAADSPLLPTIENVVEWDELVEKREGKEHVSAIITLSPSRSRKKEKEKRKKTRPPPLAPIQSTPLSPTYDNVTLEELLEASTLWAEFMGQQRVNNERCALPSAPPPPIPPRINQQDRKKSWFCNKKQEEELVGICATDRRKLGQLSPEIFRKWAKFEDECPKPKKSNSARFVDHFRSQSPPCSMSQSLHEGKGVTLTFRRYHLAPSAPETTV